MINILVTGGNGQLAHCIRDVKHEINNVNLIFVNSQELDITNKNKVDSYFKEQKIDWCVNCAAYTNVDKAEEDITLANNVNSSGVQILAQACNKFDVKLIHISTDFVFDGNSNIAYTEEISTSPISVYGSSKLKGEQHIRELMPKHYIIRTSWLYSEHGNNFMKTMLRLSEQRDELGIVSDQVGTPTYARDLAQVILKIIKINNDAFGTYHYSNEGIASWFDFATAIFKVSGKKIKTNPISTEAYPTPARRPKFSLLNKEKIKKEFSIDILDWKESLKKAIMNLETKTNINIAIEASLKAGEAIMDIYDSVIEVEYKDDKSPLTQADKKANDIINSFLLPTGIPIISEENKQTEYSTRKQWETCWVVDPVDGTKEFIKRIQ